MTNEERIEKLEEEVANLRNSIQSILGGQAISPGPVTTDEILSGLSNWSGYPDWLSW